MHHRMTTDHETISFISVLNHWRAKHLGIPTAAAFRFLEGDLIFINANKYGVSPRRAKRLVLAYEYVL
jgi:hypothetical protein